MLENVNRRIELRAVPDGTPAVSDFEIVETDVPEPGKNEVLVRTLYLSVDPYVRLEIGSEFAVGDVLRSGVVGEVLESNSTEFSRGDIVTGGYLNPMDWADYSIRHETCLDAVDPSLAPISTRLGVLGMPGRTAYFGMLDVGEPKPNDTVVVSGAAGAVGSIAGQIASLNGCRVVGIAGSNEKTTWLTDGLGFNAAIDYRETSSMEKAVRDACPDGVDVYFDNVGGPVTDAVTTQLNEYSRISVCGQIAHYNEADASGPRLLPKLNHSVVVDFTVGDYQHRYDEANRRLAGWVTDGSVTFRETIAEGLENVPEAFIGLFEGSNIGKQLVKVSKN